MLDLVKYPDVNGDTDAIASEIKIDVETTKIAAVVGSTASGKTALSVELAKRFGGEIISCDSMQIYEKMDIGTAKPTESEKCGILHHMIDIVAPDATFSCADYAAAAKAKICEIGSRGNLPIFCGGTGLYLEGVLRSGGFEESETDLDYRKSLYEFAEREGKEALHALLREIDADSADAIHPNNVKRVIRAMEIYHSTGITKTELDRRSRLSPSQYDACVIGLRYNDRELLYGRIERRVDEMIGQGLVDEVRELYLDGVFDRSATACQAIGYKELLGYIKGDMELCEAVANIKLATRRYAKRQITWFGNHFGVKWVDADRDGKMREFSDIVSDASGLLEAHLSK